MDRTSEWQREPPHGQCWEAWLRPNPRTDPVLVLLSVSAACDPVGRATGFRWILRDITSTRQIERDLQSERDFSDAILATARMIILVTDQIGRIARANEYVYGLCGLETNALHGKTWWSALLPEESGQAARSFMSDILALGMAEVIYPMRAPTGPARLIAWSGSRLPGGLAGQQVLLLGYDITELQDAQQKTLHAARLAGIGEMMAGIAHESRNALQRSHACLTRLSWRLQADTEALDLLERAQKAEQEVVRLHEDVRSYASPLTLQLEQGDLMHVWREAWQQAIESFPNHQTHLCEQSACADLSCRMDPFRLTQVFRNLFDNALAAGKASPVQVWLSCTDVIYSSGPAVQISLRDNGPGFTSEQEKRLFEPFFTTKIKGTGLGMPIARRVVEAHGGTIMARTATEGGAEICIILPRKPS